MPPKFRLFAGPNGSGKTSLFDYLKKNGFIHTELYINADRYEHELKENLRFNFNAYRVKVSYEEFSEHLEASTLYIDKIKDKNFIKQISIKAGILNFNIPKNEINSYHASLVTSYLVDKLIETNQSFSFETVMSHKSKVILLDIAKSKGYKTYLYFVYTDNPELNVTRVKLRALMGLHNVNAEIVKSRYKRTFELLPMALKIADEAYIIDNSEHFVIVAEKRNNVLVFNKPSSDKIEKLLGKKL
ncbi:MAG TPA: zeta toxin family protein [Mucilaginibacter sp.]|jgi:predicted ABC-type ATPase